MNIQRDENILFVLIKMIILVWYMIWYGILEKDEYGMALMVMKVQWKFHVNTDVEVILYIYDEYFLFNVTESFFTIGQVPNIPLGFLFILMEILEQ